MEDTLLKRLKALILFRAFFITLIVGSFFVLDIGYLKFPYPKAIPLLLVPLYALSVAYAVLLPRIRNLPTFTYIQLVIDSVAEVILIFLTGGVESWFSSTMLFTVMAAAIILNTRAGYVIATVCSILYGSMIDLQYYRALPIPFDPLLTEKDFLFNIFTHISALYLTAFLTGHLSSRLEKTTQRLAEKDLDLRDLTLFNRDLIENLPSGLLTTDRAGRILIFNRAAEQITGVDRHAAAGQQITSVFPFLSVPGMSGRIEGLILAGNETRTIGLTVSATRDSEEQQTGYICVFQDITKLKNLEAELKHKETLAAIGELSANMAHEIRNPLASLKGSIEMLKEGVLAKEHADKLMDIAVSEMDRLNKIISDFLSYSRPKPPEFSVFDLHVMLDETLELLRHSLPRPDLVTIRKTFSGPVDVFADPHKLRQVFLNLGTNAIEAMPGGGELTVETRLHGGAVSIVFRDTGSGIPPKHLREIFYPFFTTKDTGTGLGLSIAYRIMEEHHGTINVASAPGKGTTFEVVLPAAPGSAAPALAPAADGKR